MSFILNRRLNEGGANQMRKIGYLKQNEAKKNVAEWFGLKSP